MSQVKIQGNASGTGTLTIAAPNTNSDYTLTLPTSSGTVATLATVTNNGVVYVNSSGQPTSGSALTFDGTTFAAPLTSLSGNGVVLTVDRTGTGGNDRTNVQFSNSGTVRGGIGTLGAADGIYFNQGTTEGMRLTSTGLGIGTTSPATLLHVNGSNSIARFSGASTSLSAYQTFFNNSAAQAYFGIESSTGTGILGSGSAYGMVLTTASTNPLVFGTNGAERARIDTSGNLLVGTTSAGGTGTTIYRIASGNAGAPGAIYFNGSSTSTETCMAFQYNGTNVGSITRSTTATAYVTSSDYRLKHDIAPMTGALDRVAALKPVTYKWNADHSDGEGFIAHELQAVVPDAVVGEKDAVDADGNPVYQGIDTSFLVATLTAAIQELKDIVDAQGAEIAALKGTA